MDRKTKLASAIVKHRTLILILMLLLTIGSVFMIPKTKINYDLTRYLSEDTMTKKALKVMEAEFGSSQQLRLLFYDRTEEQLDTILSSLNAREEVLAAAHDAAQNQTDEEGRCCQLITLTLNACNTSAFVTQLRTLFPDQGTYLVGGSAASQLDVQKSVGQEIPGVMVISVIIVILVLLLSGRAWLEPLMLLPVLGISIVINMGTNFVFPSVSFITFAVCAILQLALSIDYAIMLLHTWNDHLKTGLDAKAAMILALSQCFMRISSSALTTAAGLLSLLFMSFTIGFDIGMVLTKGILISMLGVFTLMPSLTLLLAKPLQKTGHKQLRFGGEILAGGIARFKLPVAAVMILCVLGGAVLSSMNTYTFYAAGTVKNSETSQINRIFGASDPLVLLLPSGDSDEDYARQAQLTEALLSLTRADGTPMIKNISSMVTTGAAALKYYTVQDVAQLTHMGSLAVSMFFFANGFGDSVRADQLLAAAQNLAADNETVNSLSAQLDTAKKAFIGTEHHRMLLETTFIASDSDFNACMDQIINCAHQNFSEGILLTGNAMSTYDIGNAFHSDLMKVNLITLFAILLIVVLSFRSFLLPALLVLVIEGAIFITMGISKLTSEPIFFISYLICLSIQMGATIDYGILLCDQYRMERRSGTAPVPALAAALHRGLPTVLCSGIILITAGFIIGQVCSIYYISSIGALIARGALVSVVLVLTLLPALLLLFDRLLFRKKKD